MPGRYARGTEAWGLCQKCGLRFLLRDLTFDGYYPNLRVCTGCYDDKQPQEFLIDVTDPQALYRPSPEFGPIAPVLSGAVDVQDETFVLTWTEAQPRGNSRVAQYLVYREFSATGTFPDGGNGTLLATLNLQYWADPGWDLADLVENGSSRQPRGNDQDDNEGIAVEQLTYADPLSGLTQFGFYRYHVIAVFAGQDQFKQARSNNVTIEVAVVSTSTGEQDHLSGNFTAGTLVSGLFFTSRPYPVEIVESIHISGIPVPAAEYDNPIAAEPMHISGLVIDGTLFTALLVYDNWPLDVADEQFHLSPDFIAGTLISAVVNYTNWPLDVADEQYHLSSNFIAGTMINALVQYQNWPLDVADEQYHISANLIAGTLV